MAARESAALTVGCWTGSPRDIEEALDVEEGHCSRRPEHAQVVLGSEKRSAGRVYVLIDETCKFRIFSAHSDYTGSDDPGPESVVGIVEQSAEIRGNTTFGDSDDIQFRRVRLPYFSCVTGRNRSTRVAEQPYAS